MPDNGAQKRSRSFLLAVEDQEFLLRDEMRPFRFGMEYAKAESRCATGACAPPSSSSAAPASPSREQAEAEARSARTARREARGEARGGQSRCMRMRAPSRASSRCAAGALAASLRRDNVIATGGGPGIMEAANRGAADVGAPSIGFNITLPHEQDPNPWSTPALTFRFHYFAMRKMHLAMRANALAVFPAASAPSTSCSRS
jgi:hypothetical protein